MSGFASGIIIINIDVTIFCSIKNTNHVVGRIFKVLNTLL